MHVLYVAPEVAPYSSSGELGELAGLLPIALREAGHQVTVITPFYRDIRPEQYGLARRLRKVPVPVGNQQAEVGLLQGKLTSSDVEIIFVDHPPSFDREGLYGDSQGLYADNYRRFYLLCRSALAIADSLGLTAEVIHAHGWQTGFLPLLLRQGLAPAGLQAAKVLFTVYDNGRASLADPAILDELRLGYELFHPEGIEFHGKVSLQKAGVVLAARISAPSLAYARELQTEAGGGGLHGLFAARRERLCGVQPGIDEIVWDPATDHRIAAHYSAESIGGKETCKRALQNELGLPVRSQLPLLVMPGPFAAARGTELLLSACEKLPEGQLQLALVGEGEDPPALRELVERQPSTVVRRPELYPQGLHRLLAGADALLLPWEEAPGTTLQLKALRYGTIPVVRAVGALQDTVVNFDAASGTGTGIVFEGFESEAVLAALHRVLYLFRRQGDWLRMSLNGMRQHFPIRETAQRYLSLYEALRAEGLS